ncbi:hypothetical protein Aglo01_04110 [Actinokineospora globicatena]|nr:hypothetical protein Aglo01_04110 [Actinokineospora globicatena]GLW82769.1 hypothetical protein Aglo02_04090 [Actinokineospora globicatena]
MFSLPPTLSRICPARPEKRRPTESRASGSRPVPVVTPEPPEPTGPGVLDPSWWDVPLRLRVMSRWLGYQRSAAPEPPIPSHDTVATRPPRRSDQPGDVPPNAAAQDCHIATDHTSRTPNTTPSTANGRVTTGSAQGGTMRSQW